MTEKQRLRKAGAMTIHTIMDVMDGQLMGAMDGQLGYGHRPRCGFCRYYRKNVDYSEIDWGMPVCENCPIYKSEGVECYVTSWFPDELFPPISYLQARILWIHEATGAPIPTRLD